MACWSPVGSDGEGRKICQVPVTFSPARVPRWSLPRTASGLIPNTAAASLTVTVGRLLLACRWPVGVLSLMPTMIAHPEVEAHIPQGLWWQDRPRRSGIWRVDHGPVSSPVKRGSARTRLCRAGASLPSFATAYSAEAPKPADVGWVEFVHGAVADRDSWSSVYL